MKRALLVSAAILPSVCYAVTAEQAYNQGVWAETVGRQAHESAFVAADHARVAHEIATDALYAADDNRINLYSKLDTEQFYIDQAAQDKKYQAQYDKVYGLAKENSSRIDSLESDIARLDDAIASTAAIAGMAVPSGIGDTALSMGLGFYNHSDAFAFGLTHRVNALTTIKASVAGNLSSWTPVSTLSVTYIIP